MVVFAKITKAHWEFIRRDTMCLGMLFVMTMINMFTRWIYLSWMLQPTLKHNTHVAHLVLCCQMKASQLKQNGKFHYVSKHLGAEMRRSASCCGHQKSTCSWHIALVFLNCFVLQQWLNFHHVYSSCISEVIKLLWKWLLWVPTVLAYKSIIFPPHAFLDQITAVRNCHSSSNLSC